MRPALRTKRPSVRARCPLRRCTTDAEQLPGAAREHDSVLGGRWAKWVEAARVVEPQRVPAGAQHERIRAALHGSQCTSLITDHQRGAKGAKGCWLDALRRSVQRDASGLATIFAAQRDEPTANDQGRRRRVE